ncbi:hypothetical protein [Leptospira sp. GIMC2001]|uniref:hypothetical protein n=1 Tax=Leptospira sp. GIMC2001 TaxID=1513297 RepID=UPI00234A1555|nr:hypothetical protein [Leptospira sp. GIMC2001]WCL50069.1 hypothetical protein O4O04_04420 [Leptospira sp. GIMC2001]
MRKILITTLCLFSFSGCFPALEKSIFEFLSLVQMMQSRSGGYRLLVQVSGLSGSGLVIQVNSSSDLNVREDGQYEFDRTFKANEAYNVSILTQPNDPIQECSVAGGNGVFGSGNVTSVLINCAADRFAIGGSITGLEGITGITITNNGGDSLTIFSPNAEFAFPTTLVAGVSYNVEISAQPNHPIQNCTITNGSGTISETDITNINISCTTLGYPIEVEVSGLSSGNLSLRLNGSQNLNLSANGIYLFPNDVLIGDAYNLNIFAQPTNHICSINPSSGFIVGSKITVDANCFSIIDQNPRNQTLLMTDQSIRFVFSDSVNVASCVGVGPSTLDLVAGSPNFVLSTTNFANDTLTVTPNGSTWNTGIGRTVTLDCTSNAGKSLGSTDIVVTYLVPSSIRYVKDVGGNDLNNGLSPATAKRNIQSAIDSLLVCPGMDCAVLVEQGAYEPNQLLDSIVLNVDGVSLYGSYVAGTNFTERDDTARNSNIFMDTPPLFCNTAVLANPCKVIHVTSAITNNTQINGFTIGGADGPVTVGILLEGGAIIRNNTIQGGTALTNSYGIAAINSESIIRNNTSSGGICNQPGCTSAGIRINSTVVTSHNIKFNTFNGGVCTANGCRSTGIELVASAATNLSGVNNNSFTGANINFVYLNAESMGYYGNGFYAGELHSNSFIGGNAPFSYGFYSSNGLAISIGSLTLGNVIRSGNATVETTGLRITGNGARIVRNNSIESGSITSAGASANNGAYITGNGNVNFENNLVRVGSSESTGTFAVAYGLQLGAIPGTSVIARNRIIMGTVTGVSNGSTNYGIHSDTGGPYTIVNNVIEPGQSNFKSRGISLANHFNLLKIHNNTISSGVGTSSGLVEVASLFLGNSTQIDVRNNILILNSDSGENACIHYTGGGLTSVYSNVYMNCGRYMFNSGSSLTTICPSGVLGNSDCSITLAGPSFQENTDVNPSLQSPLTTPYDFRFSDSSPCSITRNPNAIAGVNNDILGNLRPGTAPGISLGAFEYDGACLP